MSRLLEVAGQFLLNYSDVFFRADFSDGMLCLPSTDAQLMV